MSKGLALMIAVGAATGCEHEPCFAPGEVQIEISGTFVVDDASEVPPCWPQGAFLALPEPLHATIVDDGTWTFEDPALSVVLYPDECLFTLIQQLDSNDPARGDFHDQLSYIALTRPAPDVWQGSGVLRRSYADDTMCENRVAGVTITLTWP
jgi:hypothetical protein